MSLLKQLLLSVTLAIACILVGTLVFSINGARQYLSVELQAQGENAASSLALSLSQPANQDEVTRELLMSALFDTGQFRSLQFVGTSGEVLFERSMPASTADGVPAWFSTWLPLETPVAQRAVSDGWKQVGELSIAADDAYARKSLWNTSLRVFLLVVGAGLLWAVFAIFLIRWLKRALKDEITEQVRMIAEGESAAPVQKSRVAELAQATRMISDVRERVRATAQEQSERIESLQLELNSDPVTGLANRKYFLNELRRVLQADASAARVAGHVLIFRQRDLGALNATLLRSEADQWLHSVGQAVTKVTQDFGAPDEYRPQLARLNGSDFVILMPHFNGPDATRLVQDIRQALNTLRVRVNEGRFCRWGMALTDYGSGCDVSGVLARLDHGLMKAESAGHDDVEYVFRGDEPRTAAPFHEGETAWRNLLNDALAQNKLELSAQPVVYQNDSFTQRHEASLALRDASKDGALLSGYLFMPAAVRLGLSDECDLRAIELGLAWLLKNEGILVLRVSLPSLVQSDFLSRMQLRLQAAQSQLVQRLVLEVDAHGLVAYGNEVEEFCKLTTATGAMVGLRRLAEQPAALLHLHQAPLSYVKLGGDLVGSLLASPGALQLMQAIAGTATNIGVKVYADDVLDAATAAELRAHGVLVPTVHQVRGDGLI